MLGVTCRKASRSVPAVIELHNTRLDKLRELSAMHLPTHYCANVVQKGGRIHTNHPTAPIYDTYFLRWQNGKPTLHCSAYEVAADLSKQAAVLWSVTQGHCLMTALGISVLNTTLNASTQSSYRMHNMKCSTLPHVQHLPSHVAVWQPTFHVCNDYICTQLLHATHVMSCSVRG